MHGYFYEFKWTFQKLGKVYLFYRNFFQKSDKCAYITGFNRGVQIIFPEIIHRYTNNYMHVATLHAVHGKCLGASS